MCAEGLFYGSSWVWVFFFLGPCEGRESLHRGGRTPPLCVRVSLCASGGIPPPCALFPALCKKKVLLGFAFDGLPGFSCER